MSIGTSIECDQFVLTRDGLLEAAIEARLIERESVLSIEPEGILRPQGRRARRERARPTAQGERLVNLLLDAD